jgi:hypothetical protein
MKIIGQVRLGGDAAASLTSPLADVDVDVVEVGPA